MACKKFTSKLGIEECFVTKEIPIDWKFHVTQTRLLFEQFWGQHIDLRHLQALRRENEAKKDLEGSEGKTLFIDVLIVSGGIPASNSGELVPSAKISYRPT